MKALVLGAALAFSAPSLSAQTWQWVSGTNSTARVSYPLVRSDAKGNAYLIAQATGAGTIQKQSFSPGIILVKFNSAGTALWTNNLYFNGISCFDTDSSGNIYIVTNFDESIHANQNYFYPNGHYDFLLAKLDNTGKQLWVRQFGGKQYDVCTNLCVDAAGNCYLAGNCGSDTLTMGNHVTVTPGSDYFFLARVDASGNVSWSTRGLQNSSARFGRPAGMKLKQNGELLAVISGSPLYAATFNPAGTLLTHSIFPTTFEDGGSEAQFDSFDNIYLRCDGERYGRGGINKFNASLQHQWRYDMGSTWDCYGLFSWQVDASGNSFFAGEYSPKEGYCSSDRASFDVLIRKIDPNGQKTWEKETAGQGDELGWSLANGRDGDVYVSGYMNYSSLERVSQMDRPVVFDSFTITPSNQVQQLFMGKIGNGTPTGIASLKNEKQALSVFPNPASQFVTIPAGGLRFPVKILSLHGQMQLSTNTTNEGQIDVSLLKDGIYLLSVETPGGTLSTKLTIQH